MTDFVALKAELDNDPLARAYASMSDKRAATSLNVTDRPSDRVDVPAQEFIEAIEPSAYPGGGKMQAYLAMLLSTGSVPLEKTNVRNALKDIFVGQAATLTALVALQSEDISRGVEIGFGRVAEGHVAHARTI